MLRSYKMGSRMKTSNGYSMSPASGSSPQHVPDNVYAESAYSSSNIIYTDTPGEYPLVVVKSEPIDDYEEKQNHIPGSYMVNGNHESTSDKDTEFDPNIVHGIKTETLMNSNYMEPDELPVFFMKNHVSETEEFEDEFKHKQQKVCTRKRNNAPRNNLRQKKASITNSAESPAVYLDVAVGNDQELAARRPKRTNLKSSGKYKRKTHDESKNSTVMEKKNKKKYATGKRRKQTNKREELKLKKTFMNGRKKRRQENNCLESNGKGKRKTVRTTLSTARRKTLNGTSLEVEDENEKNIKGRKTTSYFCDICSEDIRGARNIQQHKRQHENPSLDKPLQCTLCSMRFRLQERLEGHLRTHRGEDAFTCSTCGKGFNLVSHFKSHMRSHTKKMFQCPQCSMMFRVQERYEGHMRTHRGEDAFPCSVCGKGFRLVSHLKSHMKSHTGEKPYTCEICGKGFAEACKRVRHLKTHIRRGELVMNGISSPGDVSSMSVNNNGDTNTDSVESETKVLYRPYKCSICSKTFTRTIFMVNHVKDHDSGKIPRVKGRGKEHVRDKTCVDGTHVKNLEAAKTPKDSTPYVGHDKVSLEICVVDKIKTEPGTISTVDDVIEESGKVISNENISTSAKTESTQGSNDLITWNDVSTAQAEGDIDNVPDQVILASTVTSKPSKLDSTLGNTDSGVSSSLEIKAEDLEGEAIEEAKCRESTNTQTAHESKLDDTVSQQRCPYQCAYCDELFADERIIEAHVLLHTSSTFLRVEKTRQHTCEYCGKSFYKPGHLKAHVMIHTGERPYICEVCAKGFTESSKLTRHLKTHYNSPRKSNKKTNDEGESSLLLANQLYETFTKRRKRKKYTCEYCGKNCSTLSALTVHVMQHTGERPYTCDLCGKGFCEARTLTRHIKSHERKKDEWISGASSSEEEDNQDSDVPYPWEEEEEEEEEAIQEKVDYEEHEEEEMDWVESPVQNERKDTDESDMIDKNGLSDFSEYLSDGDAGENKTDKLRKYLKRGKRKSRKKSTGSDCDNPEEKDKEGEGEDDVDKSGDVEWSDILDDECVEESEFLPFSGFQACNTKEKKEDTDDFISDEESDDCDSASKSSLEEN